MFVIPGLALRSASSLQSLGLPLSRSLDGGLFLSRNLNSDLSRHTSRPFCFCYTLSPVESPFGLVFLFCAFLFILALYSLSFSFTSLVWLSLLVSSSLCL